MRLGAALPVAVAVTVICVCAVGVAAPSSQPSPAITSAELAQHLRALQHIADRNHGTRAAGTPGYAASAGYVAARLEDAGWTVTRQVVPFANFRLHRASLAVGGRRLTRAHDFQVMSYSGSGHATGRLRDVGLGCSRAAFKGLGRGEIPLAERGGCYNHDKAANAARAGARAIVLWANVTSRRGVPSGTLGGPGVGIPVVVASKLALGPHPGGKTARVAVRATSAPARTANVIAETPGGSGDRVVMAGGHLDSVPGGPGIDDNGSGVATLIEAAEAIGPNPPGAKVRIAFWAAEELGLLGSRHYVTSLDQAGRDRIVAYLNFDMVGSPNAVPAVYADGDAGLARVLRRASGRRLTAMTVGQSSDHTFFQINGIAINGLFTGATERGPGGRPRDPCYHLACDTTRNVNLPVLLDMAKTAAAALRTLSERHK